MVVEQVENVKEPSSSFSSNQSTWQPELDYTNLDEEVTTGTITETRIHKIILLRTTLVN